MSDQSSSPTRAERDLRAFGLLALGIGVVLWFFNIGMMSAGMGAAAAVLFVLGVVLMVAWLIVRASKS
jgi:Flp pilus assembly protein TadB